MEVPGPAAEERTEIRGDATVGLGADAPDAGGGALSDVREQARPAGTSCPVENPRTARAHREHPQQCVERPSDGPGMRIGTEIACPRTLGCTRDESPREFIAQGDGEIGVGLVVSIAHVESRVVFLDPRVLELERLHLAADDGPVDVGRHLHERARPRGQRSQIGEVGAQARSEGLRLAYVDDTALGVAEAIDPGLVRDTPGPGNPSPHHPGAVSRGRPDRPRRRHRRGPGRLSQGRSAPHRPQRRTGTHGTGTGSRCW